jgi:hypothetical protein
MSSLIRSSRKKNNPEIQSAWMQLKPPGFGAILILAVLTFTCKPGPSTQSTTTITLPTHGLFGKVVFKEGSFNSDGEIGDDGKMYGVQREIIVFELTNLRDVEMEEGDFVSYVATNPVDTIVSDYHGQFYIPDLKDGKYSLFVRENDRLYSKVEDDENYFPVTIRKDSLTKVLIEIDYLANY